MSISHVSDISEVTPPGDRNLTETRGDPFSFLAATVVVLYTLIRSTIFTPLAFDVR